MSEPVERASYEQIRADMKRLRLEAGPRICDKMISDTERLSRIDAHIAAYRAHLAANGWTHNEFSAALVSRCGGSGEHS